MGGASSEKPKKKHRKGLWSPDEDERLRNYIQKHGHGCWSSVPINAGLQRNGKSCRLRWINYLRPGLKRGAFSIAEQDTIFTLHQILGNKWSQIAHHLPGRSDNEIKNYWHSYLKKRVAKIQVQAFDSAYLNGQKNSSFESVDHIKVKAAAAAASQNEEDESLNLPKVIFADWLSLDEELGNAIYSPNLGVGVEVIDAYADAMLPSTFKWDCQIDFMYHYNQMFQ